MEFIFVDTSAWYALADTDDAEHQAAASFKIAMKVGRMLWDEELAKLVFVDRAMEQKAWELFVRYSDHKFSFTDCTSFVVMEQLGIMKAFVFDSDFESYGRFVKVP